MKIPKILLEEIKSFCNLNKVKSIDKFIISALQIGFNIEKYGNAPWKQEIEKIVEKEVIKEVPVEKIVEVEKEVIKEVEKKVFITDDEKVGELMEELDHLRDRITTKEQEIVNNAYNMKSLNEEIENKKKEITNLNEKLKTVNKNLDTIKVIPPPVDLYGDDKKGGFWGSNLKDKK
jgi:predicted RNase H-like nuclease (RuvC/YqgF family)